jgi:hypothetical protein
MNQLLREPTTSQGTGPSRRAVVLGVTLAGLSGAAILAETFTPVPMRVSVPAVVLPGAILLVLMVFAGAKRFPELDRFADRAISGAKFGLLATVAYDIIRPLLMVIFRYHFNPYRAMPVFGSLILNEPKTAASAIAAGWVYHFWNGVGFGVMFALMRPRGGWVAGLVWAMCLQGFMMWAYPTLLKLRLDNPGFMMAGLVGHAVWGVVLGRSLERWGRG